MYSIVWPKFLHICIYSSADPVLDVKGIDTSGKIDLELGGSTVFVENHWMICGPCMEMCIELCDGEMYTALTLGKDGGAGGCVCLHNRRRLGNVLSLNYTVRKQRLPWKRNTTSWLQHHSTLGVCHIHSLTPNKAASGSGLRDFF